MNCSCGGITRILYRVHSETQRWRAEQCSACGREVRWLVSQPIERDFPTLHHDPVDREALLLSGDLFA